MTTLVLLKGNVQAVWYPQCGEHFVTGLDGVSQTSPKHWGIWQFGGGKWSYLQVGNDDLDVQNGTTIAWTLCSLDASYYPTCTP